MLPPRPPAIHPPAVLAASAFVGKHLLALLAVSAAAHAAGWRFARRLSPKSLLERVVLAQTLGLALLGQVFQLLGVAGLLTPESLLFVLAVLFVAAATGGEALDVAGELTLRLRGARPIVALAVVSLFGLVFAVALYPPTAFDETMYHLPFARAFAETGGMPFLPDLRFPVFPQLWEALLAGVLLLAGDVATHLVAFHATLLTAGLLVSWGRREPASNGGAWAAALLAGSPAGIYLAGTAYVEPGLGLLGAGAVFALERWRAERASAWLVAAGLLAGSAASVKYTGLLFALVGGLVVLSTTPRRAGPVLAFTGAAAASMALAYARILAFTGQPVFPFFPGVFGTTSWDLVAFPASPGLLDRALQPLTLPFQAAWNRQAVGGLPPFSPALPIALLLLLWIAGRQPGARLLLPFVLGFLVLTPRNAHYLVAIVPLVCLGGGRGLDVLSGGWRPGLRRLLLVALALPGVLYAGWLLARRGLPPVTPDGREAYLARQLPLYPTLSFLNGRGEGVTVYGVGSENLVYLAKGRLLGDWNGPDRYPLMELVARDGATLWRALRSRGVDYLLVPRGPAWLVPERIPGFGAWFVPAYEDAAARAFRLSGPPEVAGAPQR